MFTDDRRQTDRQTTDIMMTIPLVLPRGNKTEYARCGVANARIVYSSEKGCADAVRVMSYHGRLTRVIFNSHYIAMLPHTNTLYLYHIRADWL